MAGKKLSAAAGASAADKDEPGKAELQRRMDEAREDISHTVAEIKETVADQYESVKETVSETLDWRAQFRKHSAAWSLGALAVGYVVGSSLAKSLQDTTKKKGRKDDGLFAELYAFGETLSDELSGIARTILLPALTNKIRDTLGIDVSAKLQAANAKKRVAQSGKRTTRKSPAKTAGRAKAAPKKGALRKRPAKKRGKAG